MRMKRKVAIAITMALLLGGVATAATAGVFRSLYTTPVTYTQMFGSSGNIVKLGPTGAGGPITRSTVGSVLPGQCMLIGVGDYIESTPCTALLKEPYELTETPITATSGTITYFAVTTTNPAPAADPANRIIFSVRLCENAAYGTPGCNSPVGGVTAAKCSPAPGSRTCSWIGKVLYKQWQPGGVGHNTDPGINDKGLIDVVAKCYSKVTASCADSTYDPGNVSWSVAYSTTHP